MVATMTTPIPGTLLSGPSATFNWTAGTGVSQYSVWIGSTPGAADLGNVLLATRSYTAALPATTGISLYVRLWSFIGGTWGYIDYTYTH
jgi:hypothetical protein